MRHRLYYFLAFALLAGLAPGCEKFKQGDSTSGTGGEEPAGSGGPVALTETNFEGVESAIREARGKVVLIDCWATWCGPCVKSFPGLVQKHNKYAEKGLAVISLSLDEKEDTEAVKAFLKRQKATFTNLLLLPDKSAGVGMRDKLGYGGGIPHAALFSRAGERVWAGHPMESALPGLIEAELAK